MTAKISSNWILLTMFLLGLWGYSYELSYFYAIGENVNNHLNIKHYVASGAVFIIPFFVFIAIINLIKKFFTKHVHVDDINELKNQAGKIKFENAIILARFGAFISFAFWILVIVVASYKPTFPVWSPFLFVVLMCTQSFFWAIILAPKHSVTSVVIVFSISIAFCFSATGFGM